MKNGWEAKTLGEVCEMYQPKTISVKELVEDGAYPVYGANGVIGRYNQFNHEEPQLLITCRGATCGSVNISAPRSWVTGNAMVVRPKNGRLEMRYLEYLFRGGIDISRAITGAAQPQITRTNLAPLEISYPVSKGEQQRIVGILDEAFAGLATAQANVEKNLRNARALFESHLQSVFTQRGPEWVEKTVEEVCDRLHQGLNTAGEKIKFYETGYPIIQTRNIENGVIELDTKIKFMSEGDWKRYRDKYRPELGDVFFTNIGTIGKTAIVTDDLDYLIHWNIFKLRPRCNTITSAFLKYTLDHLTSSGFFHVLQKGGTVEFVTKKMISEAVIGVPDTVEQKKVVAQLDALAAETQRLEAIYQRKLAALGELKESLLHQAFSGDL